MWANMMLLHCIARVLIACATIMFDYRIIISDCTRVMLDCKIILHDCIKILSNSILITCDCMAILCQFDNSFMGDDV